MNCNDAATLLTAYTDGETGRLHSRSIENHLATCPRCAAKHDALLALRAHLRAGIPRYPAPPELRARVLASLDAATPPVDASPRPGAARWRWLAGGALAGCAATVLAWVIVTAAVDWRVNEDVAVEVVTSHVRATLAHQLIQVASSDQHTVKPWLSARLDYSPPVPDLREGGFSLLGGRVDYVERQRVATLVYRIRDHTIDVFVRPQSARAAPKPLRSVRGFNVAHASGSGMDWLAVSDVNAEVLESFVQRLAHEGGQQGGAAGSVRRE